ncbi:MAG: vanadium-dependent haloperoxidase [Solirubrobacterales bacterium]|nr:vanadium-dependent haloperoxidase [Solirubrobacterales bacterium]
MVSVLAALAFAVGQVSPAAAAGSPDQGSAVSSPAVALDWNATAVDAVRAARVVDPPNTPARPIYQTEGLLYMSYVQAAVYDAVMKIAPRYEAYHDFDASSRHASLPAAVIAASYDTLVFYLGDPGGVLAAKYAAAIAALPADRGTARGIAVGQAAAADVEELREHDGRDAPVSTAYGTGPLQPGVWVLTQPFTPPPPFQTAQTPWMAFMRPFLLASASQFRAPSPPALTSPQYAADFNETKAYGALNSSVRTPEQTAIAQFWNANGINVDNQTLRDIASQHAMDLVDTVRLLAMGDLVTTDAGMACFDSKYTYQRWRPITAIQHADLADNPGTTADPTWSPLLPTPNHPEYPAQHGCVTSALAQVIATALGTDNINATIPGAQDGATTLTTSQTFATVHDLKEQLVNARVWAGLHFRTSVLAGETLGTHVADWALERYFQPPDQDDDNDRG